MILGIVGSEAKKFTEEKEGEAFNTICGLLEEYVPELVVSGGCHLGGIDEWAIDCAQGYGIQTQEFLPAHLSWSLGYRPRNIQIAERSDVVVCITVRELPRGFKGLRHSLCYHCGTKDHVKSGGCWTVKYARSIGRTGRIIVL